MSQPPGPLGQPFIVGPTGDLMPQNYGVTPTGDISSVPVNQNGDITLPEYAHRLPNGEPDLFGFDSNGNPTRHWIPGHPNPQQGGGAANSWEDRNLRAEEEQTVRRVEEEQAAALTAQLMAVVEQLQTAGVRLTPRRFAVASSKKPGWFGGAKRLWGNFEPAWPIGDCTWRERTHGDGRPGDGGAYQAPGGVTPSGKVVPMDQPAWIPRKLPELGFDESAQTLEKKVRGNGYNDWNWFHHARVSPVQRDPDEWERIIGALKRLLPHQ